MCAPYCEVNFARWFLLARENPRRSRNTYTEANERSISYRRENNIRVSCICGARRSTAKIGGTVSSVCRAFISPINRSSPRSMCFLATGFIRCSQLLIRGGIDKSQNNRETDKKRRRLLIASRCVVYYNVNRSRRTNENLASYSSLRFFPLKEPLSLQLIRRKKSISVVLRF